MPGEIHTLLLDVNATVESAREQGLKRLHIAAGVVYAIIAIIVMFTGYRWIEYLMPPVVTGAVVMVIGLNLAPVAISDVTSSQFSG